MFQILSALVLDVSSQELWYSAKRTTVKPLMFAAINVCVFTRRTISLLLRFCVYMRNIFLGRVSWNILLLLMFANC